MRLLNTCTLPLVIALFLAPCGARVSAQQSVSRLLTDESRNDRSVVIGESESYAARGVLRRVRNEATQAERLAIIGETGEVEAFVTPTARLNLRRYLGQNIGVTAKSVTEESNSAPSIIVDQVTLLSDAAASPASQQVPHEGSIGQAIGTAVRHVDFAESSVTPFADQVAAPGAATPGIANGVGRAIHSIPAVGGVPQIQPVQGEVVVDDGWAIAEGEPMGEVGPPVVACPSGACGNGSCGLASCRHCGTCSTCGPPGWMWVRGEYMLLWASGMHLPPLVTTGGDTPGVAGVLGEPDTEILLGDEEVLQDGRSGFRIKFGGYWGPRRRLMWEGEYFGQSSGAFDFSASSNGSGSPVLARPFFNINPRDPDTGELAGPATEDSELVSFPGILAGTVSVDVDSEIRSAGGRLRWNICCKEFACQRPNCNRCCNRGCVGPSGFTRIDFLAGYRYMSVDEELTIREDLTTLTAPAGRFEIYDSFETRNDFHGGEVGFLWEGGWRRWTLECLSKVALGNVHQIVTIDGGTTYSPLTSPQQTFTGGLLAQTSNIGRYTQDDFGVLPELGVTLGLHLTPRLRATVGYTFLFLSPVLRPGDQIDLDVNPDLLPPALDPVEGPLRPEFAFRETDLWANALNVGLDLRW